MNDGDKNEPVPGATTDHAAKTPPEAPAQEPASWQFEPDQGQSPAPSAAEAAVSWTASEFVAHTKAASWYGALALSGALLAALIYLLTRDWISTVVIIIITVIFGVFAARKPRVLNYSLDQVGVHIAQKFYAYGDFKSFSVLDEGGLNSILLTPLKRFMPSITVYYAPTDEDRIIDVLSRYLPFEDRDHDMVDRFMRRVKF